MRARRQGPAQSPYDASCAITYLRVDNTGAWVMEVFPSLLCDAVAENIHLYIK